MSCSSRVPDDDGAVEQFRRAEKVTTVARRHVKSAWRTMAKSLFVQLAHLRRTQTQQKTTTTSRSVYREVMQARSIPESAAFVLARANWVVCVARLFLSVLRRDVLFHRAAEKICSKRYVTQKLSSFFYAWRNFTRFELRRRNKLVRFCANHWCQFVQQRLNTRRILERFRTEMKKRMMFRKHCALRRLRIAVGVWRLRSRALRTLRAQLPMIEEPLRNVFDVWKLRTERRLWSFAANKRWETAQLGMCFTRWRQRMQLQQAAVPPTAPNKGLEDDDASTSTNRKQQKFVLVRVAHPAASDANMTFKLHCADRIYRAVVIGTLFTRWRQLWRTRRASACYRRSVLQKGIETWRDRLYERLASRIVVSRVFSTWRLNLQMRQDHRVARELASTKCKRSYFSMWQTSLCARKQNRACPLRRCLKLWAEKTAVRRCRAALNFGKMRRHLLAWRTFCRKTISKRTNALLAAAIHAEVVRAGCFMWWKKKAEESARLTMMVSVLDTLRLERLRKKCFDRWQKALRASVGASVT